MATLEDQLKLETISLTEGYNRYVRSESRLKEDQGYAATSSVSQVIRDAIPQVALDIERFLEADYKGRYPDGHGYLKDLEVTLSAYIGLSCVFNAISRNRTLSQTCIDAGRFVENELWAKALKSHDKTLYQRLVARVLKTHGNIVYRKKAIRATAAKEGFKYESLPDDVRAKIGEPLVNAVLKVCQDVFELYEDRKDNFIGLSEEASSYLTELRELEAWMHPAFKPMIIPPKPWVSYDTGCYYSETLSRHVKLLRTRSKEHRALVSKAVTSGLMQPCLESLNTIQATPWTINQRALEVVQWAWEQGVTLDSFPPRFPLQKPPRPVDWDTLEDSRKKAWRIKASKVAERNRGIVGEAMVINQDLATATEMLQYPRFFLPHSMDFRGRVYAIPHFSIQRSDYVRSLFKFAEGVPLGPDGLYWLAVHIANTGDFDKLSKRPLDERVRWVTENSAMIEKVAKDPFGTFDIWKKADAPFQFCAAAMEWAEAIKDPEGYVSHLPIALDGSNSGLQHYSATMRSMEGALVNLVASETPSDVYQVVCDKARAIVESDAAKGDEVAKVVLKNGVSRSIVKRNVMTFAYSSEQYGFAQQQREDLMRPLSLEVLEGRLEEHPYGADHGFAASLYIAKVVWTAVNEVVTDASLGMKFFQRCAQVLAHEAKALVWFTPIGLPVLHKYVTYQVKQVSLWLYDKRLSVGNVNKEDRVEDGKVIKWVRSRVRLNPTEVINKDKQKSAVAPNIIHSLDAAHLMLTVLEAHEVGINHFSLIHDSFGTHAGNTTRFFQIIRETFVQMYEEYDPLEEIHSSTIKAADDKTKVPQPPVRGPLDIRGVINSLYAFA